MHCAYNQYVNFTTGTTAEQQLNWLQLYVAMSSKNIVLLSYSTQSNPTHRKLQNFDPTRRSTQPMDRYDTRFVICCVDSIQKCRLVPLVVFFQIRLNVLTIPLYGGWHFHAEPLIAEKFLSITTPTIFQLKVSLSLCYVLMLSLKMSLLLTFFLCRLVD